MNDSLLNIESLIKIKDLESVYLLEKKEKENQKLALENEIKDLAINQGKYLAYGLVILFLSAALCAYFFMRQQRYRQLKKEMELKHQLMRAQMNPHFIFNAITSIQTYILDNEPQVAYDYLAKFARLIRNILYYAEERTLSLEKEVEMLKLYIEVEQMRFTDRFNYVLKLDSDIDPSTHFIPAMIVQPFVENAIWHGLMPLNNQREGYLKVLVYKKSRWLEIIVEDNGIGRTASETINKKPEHRSMGLALVKERLDLYNKQTKSNVSRVIVEDILDLENNVCGTKVVIYLPLIISE
jgi:LytS/YehU family sensor histidine kinase